MAAAGGVPGPIRLVKARTRVTGTWGLVAFASAAFLAAVAAVVLAGWLLDIPILTHLSPAWPSMKFNTAACFLAMGAAIALRSSGALVAARVPALLVLALGFTSLVEYALGQSLGIDNLVIQDTPGPANPTPGRMSPVTSVCFVVLGAAHWFPARWAAAYQFTAAAILLAATFVLTTYLYLAIVLVRFTDMALATALCFLAASLGTAAAQPTSGMPALLRSDDLGGKVARRLLLFAFALPIGLGYVQIFFVNAHLVGHGQAEALTAVLLILCAAFVIAWAARAVQRLHVREQSKSLQLATALAHLNEAEKATVRGSFAWRANGPTAWSDSMYLLLAVPKGHDTGVGGLLPLLHPDDRKAFEQEVAQAFVKPGSYARDARVIRPEGTIRWLRFEAVATADAQGRVVEVSGSAQDITDQRALEVERQRGRDKQKDLEVITGIADFKSRFINLAAHELRTPLTPIQLGLATLRRQTAGLPGGAPPAVANLQRNVDRLASLTQNLVDAANLQSAQIILHRSPTDLSSLVTQVAAAFEPLAARKGIRIVCPSGKPLEAFVDERKIETGLHHLVSNAIKFTPSGGQVTIGLEATASEATLMVRDTGAGLRGDQLARLFQPFVQVHVTMEVSELGPGLGLYIARGIAELHGGRLSAESAGIGHGCTFSMTFPLAEHAASTSPRIDAAARSADG